MILKKYEKVKIYVIHGIVDDKSETNSINKNFIDKKSFELFLQKKKKKFIDLKEAINKNEGDVLTIDDSLVGAFKAARLASMYDHKVTMFLNPFFIEKEKHFCYSLLNQIIYETKKKFIIFHYQLHKLKTYKERKKFRKYIKTNLLKLKTVEERRLYLNSISNKLKTCIPTLLPPFARVINEKHLQILKEDRNISIENHGWDHTCVSQFNKQEFFDDINKTSAWIKSKFNYQSSIYAVPFGDTPLFDLPDIIETVLLHNQDLKNYDINASVYNRISLTDEIISRTII